MRRSTKCALKRDAVVKAAEMQRAEEVTSRTSRPVVTITQALHDYVLKLEARKQPSAIESRYIAAKLNDVLPKGLHLHDLLPRHLENIKRVFEDRGNKPQTICHALRTLRSASNYAHLMGNAAADIKKWGLPKVASKTRWLTAEEVEAVLKGVAPKDSRHASNDDRRAATGMVMTLVGTGMRWGECASLRWGDVDVSERVVSVVAGKTDTVRTVPLTDALCDWLRGYREHGGGGKGDLVFGRGGKKRDRCALLAHVIDDVCNTPENVRRNGRATVHSLRHTYASRLRQGGAGLDEVSDMLGHASLQMTRRYAHLGKQETQDRVRAILNVHKETTP